jgi:hypothetical protein
MCTSKGEPNISREIDVMVSDSEGEMPWFIEGNLVIAPPTSVIAQIHVKTEFNVEELSDVLLSGAHNQQVFNSNVSGHGLWFGAVFFARTKAISTKQLRRIWKNAITKATKETEIKRTDLPDCVAIIDGPVFLPNKIPEKSKDCLITIRSFDCGKASPAVFLSHFYESVAVSGKDSTRRGEWFHMISKICNETSFTGKFPYIA